MGILAPLGLIGLSAILAVIIIYLIKPPYKNRTVSSTFVWKLSLKLSKKRRKWDALKNSLILALQIFIVGCLGLMMAQPFLSLNIKSGEKVIILDCSASMAATAEGKSRFERALDEVIEIAEDKKAEDKFTVIAANNKPDYLMYRVDSLDYIVGIMKETECEETDCDIAAALTLAEAVLEENSKANVILITDCDYESSGYIDVTNVSSEKEWNVGITELKAELDGGYYKFTANLISTKKSPEISAKLYIDGEYKSVKAVSLLDGEPYEIIYDDLNITEFEEAKVIISGGDSFGLDDEYVLYNQNEIFKVQLVSDTPNFLRSALLSVGGVSIDAVGYDGDIKTEGYDLYIFEGIDPQFLPADGAVWIFNPYHLPVEYGVTFGEPDTGPYNFSSSENLSEKYSQIISGISAEEIEVSEYTPILDANGYQSIFDCNMQTAAVAGEIGKTKVMIFSFDLHKSNLPLLLDFTLLISNLKEECIPYTVDRTLVTAGEDVEINLRPNITGAEIEYAGEKTPLKQSPEIFKARKVGEYQVKQYFEGDASKTNNFFVCLSPSESDFSYTGGILAPEEYPGKEVSTDKEEVDIIPYLAGLMLLLIILEWGLYYREQY